MEWGWGWIEMGMGTMMSKEISRAADVDEWR